MKKRIGFVSNSSSSSFLIYGVYTSKEDILTYKELLEKSLVPSLREYYQEDPSEYLRHLGLYCSKGPYDDNNSYYIGCSWDEIKDDETGSQFKKRVEEFIKKVVKNQNIECGTCSEAWMNN